MKPPIIITQLSQLSLQPPTPRLLDSSSACRGTSPWSKPVLAPKSKAAAPKHQLLVDFAQTIHLLCCFLLGTHQVWPKYTAPKLIRKTSDLHGIEYIWIYFCPAELSRLHHEEQLNSRFLAAYGFSSKTINGLDGSFMDWIFTWHLSKMDSMLQLFNTNDWKLLVSGSFAGTSYLGFPTVRLSVGILAGSATWIRTSVPEAVAWDGTSKTLSTQNHHQYQQNQSSSEMPQFPVCFFSGRWTTIYQLVWGYQGFWPMAKKHQTVLWWSCMRYKQHQPM